MWDDKLFHIWKIHYPKNKLTNQIYTHTNNHVNWGLTSFKEGFLNIEHYKEPKHNI